MKFSNNNRHTIHNWKRRTNKRWTDRNNRRKTSTYPSRFLENDRKSVFFFYNFVQSFRVTLVHSTCLKKRGEGAPATKHRRYYVLSHIKNSTRRIVPTIGNLSFFFSFLFVRDRFSRISTRHSFSELVFIHFFLFFCYKTWLV